MLFGALKSCPHCSDGHLHYSGGTYKCRGFLTEWSKCSYSTSEPERVKGKWNIPEDTNNKYLSKVSKNKSYVYYTHQNKLLTNELFFY